jgi:hypothetical protein
VYECRENDQNQCLTVTTPILHNIHCSMTGFRQPGIVELPRERESLTEVPQN